MNTDPPHGIKFSRDAYLDEPDDSFETLFPAASPLQNPIYRRRRRTVWCSMFLVISAVVLVAAYFLGLLDGLFGGDSVSRSVLRDLDKDADPCQDFYQYACGGWLQRTRIPPDRSSYSRSFSNDYEEIRRFLRKLLDKELWNDPKSKAGTFYKACMRSAYIAKEDWEPMLPFAKVIQRAVSSSPPSIAKAIGELRALGVGTTYGMYLDGDFDEPSKYTMYLGQGGLALPGRNYYIQNDTENTNIRKAYHQFTEQMFSDLARAGRSKKELKLDIGAASEAATSVLEFETMLAVAAAPPDEVRDPSKTNNRITATDRQKLLIEQTLLGWGAENETIQSARLVIDYPPFFSKYADMLQNVDAAKWRAYLTAHALRALAGEGLLGSKPKDQLFELSKVLYGVKVPMERWKFCYGKTNGYAGEALGSEFVKRRFPEEDKGHALTFVKQIQAAFGRALDKNEWMDSTTKDAAREKLNGVGWKIGFSEKLDLLEDVQLHDRGYSDNIAKVERHATLKELAKFKSGQVQKEEWFMLPHEVNAYYEPSMNEMVFPAGILQPPFYSDQFPASMNYGGIGAVMGHELSHGFDDGGRNYDKNGKLRDWWTHESGKKFENRTQCVVDLYSGFSPSTLDENLNGRLTLGENLADIGGLGVAFRAFKAQGKEASNLAKFPTLKANFNADQLFFVGYAQTWCSKYENGALRSLIETNPHSPGMFRVQGPLSQFDPFADAFKCKKKTAYNPTSKCKVW